MRTGYSAVELEYIVSIGLVAVFVAFLKLIDIDFDVAARVVWGEFVEAHCQVFVVLRYLKAHHCMSLITLLFIITFLVSILILISFFVPITFFINITFFVTITITIIISVSAAVTVSYLA